MASETTKKKDTGEIRKISEVSALINSSLDHDEIVRRAVEYLSSALNAEASSLILIDEEGLYFQVATGRGSKAVKKVRLKRGEGIAGWVAEKVEPVIVNDPYSDPRFSTRADEKSGVATRNIIAVPLTLRDELKGVIEVINRLDGDFHPEDIEILQCLSNSIAVALDNARLYREMKETFQSMIQVLAELIELRDSYTGGHTERVKNYSLLIGEKMGLDSQALEALSLAAVLHDVGKIGVRDSILLKNESLDDEEYRLMSMHAEFGAKVLERVGNLDQVIGGIRHHHERYDGGGYPRGLKGEEIPVIARIISVADTFDAITSTRPYRTALPPKDAIKELKRCAGRQFDPQVVEILAKAYREGVLL